MEQKIRWSHSSLKDYEGCARRHYEVKVLKNYPFIETKQVTYGKEFHTAAENFAKDDTPLPKQFSFSQQLLDSLLKKDGRKFPEYEMGVTKNISPCSFNAKDAWVRGIIDLLIVDDENFTAWVFDYKTGNDKYPDIDQLKLMSLLTFAHFPHVKEIKAALLFVVKNSIVKHKVTVADRDKLWWEYRERVAKLEASYANDVWNPTQTPLCNWCPVSSCEFNPRH